MTSGLSVTVVQLLAQQSDAEPDAPFVEVLGDHSETRAQVLASSSRIVAGLVALGVTAGDAVVVMAQNSFAGIHSWFGINMAGGVEVAINTA